MPKMAHMGEHHRHTRLIRSVNHFAIPDRATRLDDRGNARARRCIYTVSKRKNASEAITDPGTANPSSAALIPAIFAL